MVTAGAALSFAACACVAFGPAMILFVMLLLPHPHLVILTVGSAFLWLVGISFVALAWALLPSPLWLLVIYASVIQEGTRWLSFIAYERLLCGVESMGQRAVLHSRISGAGKIPIALANGVGIGMAQALVLHGDVLARALRPGTLYSPSCPAISVFALSALSALGILLVNILLSVIGWTVAYTKRSPRLIALMLVLRVLASSSTLWNSHENAPIEGCCLSLSMLFTVVFLTAGVTVHLILASVFRSNGKD
ncbi:MAG: hypothetical protein SGPRY_009727 [Prymnesium sp.]